MNFFLSKEVTSYLPLTDVFYLMRFLWQPFKIMSPIFCRYFVVLKQHLKRPPTFLLL